MPQTKKSVAYLSVYEQGSKRKTKLGEPYSKVDDDCQDHKIETHYARMNVDEEYATKIAKREAKAFACEIEQEKMDCTVRSMTHMIVNPIVMRHMWMSTAK